MNDNKHSADCGCSRCLECIIGRQKAQISTLQEKHRWIPVSEGLPDTETMNLGLLESGNIVQLCDADWVNPAGVVNEQITHWMPIPDLPTGEDRRKESK